MEFVSHYDIAGVESKQIPSIVGNGAPTTSTKAAVGCMYMDNLTGRMYRCTAVSGESYTWEENVGAPGRPGNDGTSPIVSVSNITGGHRITITDKTGTKNIDVMDGEPGRTPVVGEDYFTNADKREIAEQAAELVEIPPVDLTGYAKTEDIPKKPEDIGAQPAGNYATVDQLPSVPVQSVNGKTGAVYLSAADVKARPDNWTPTAQDVGARPNTWIPTAQEVGALPDTYTPPNQTAEQVGADPKGTAASAVSQHNASEDSHNDIRLALKAINDRLTAFFDSDDATLDELSEIVEYITSNKTLIEAITTSKVSVSDIVNNLTTNAANKPLSAAQGVVLKGLIDAVSNSLSDYALKSAIPTKASQLTNDAGYLTQHQDISGKLDASELPTAISTALAQAAASGEFDGKDGRGIKSIVRTAGNGAAGTTDTYTITYTDNTTAKLTVYNGKNGTNGTSVTVKSVSESSADGGSNVVTFSDGTTITIKNGQTGAPGKTPVRGVDYWTADDIAAIDADIATELAKRGQLKPEFANSIEDCTDTTKMYVLPDGFIYAYMLTEKEVDNGPAYTNRLPLAVNSSGGEYVGDNDEDGYRDGYRVSSSGTEKEAAGYQCTGFIPAVAGDTIRIKNVTQLTTTNDGSAYTVAYFFSSAYAKVTGSVDIRTNATYSDGIYTFTIPSYSGIAYFRVTLIGVTSDTIITVNEEIKEGGGTTIVKEYAWTSTGHAFVPADYEDRIVALEEETAQNTADISALKKGSSKATPIKTWDAPIYDANIPVFQLSSEKAAITESEKTVSAVYAKYDALMARHPHYITKTDLGMCSDGVTPVYRYDFREPEPHRGITGNKEWSETKAKAIIVSGIHWEWGGIFSLYNALEELADNPDLFHLRRNTHLIVLPVCNPYAVANMSVRNANLVEIHRNFEVDFIYPGEAGYIELGERSHGGTAPLSEVETQYMDNIMKANTDAAFFLTCHSNQSDTVYGTGFTWASPATYYMCNMHYRLVDKLSNVWMKKYGDELAAGIADYRTENTPEWDNRLGSAYLSTTNGTETKQATKYGIQATNIEVTDAFLAHGTKANPEPALSSFTMSRGAEVYVNFLLTAFGAYDPKDKALYG